MSELLIGTGFFATKQNYTQKREFLRTWLDNTPGDVVIIDNSEIPLDSVSARVIRINNNLGVATQFQGLFRPYLLGHTISWIMPMMIAYSENKDFIYKEQDSLWFGDVAGSLAKRGADCDLVAQIGYITSSPMRIENCLFWVRHDYQVEFWTKYCEISEGDGMKISEEKFEFIARYDRRIVAISFGVGRDRPLPIDDPVWYAQRFTEVELSRLKKKGLI